MPNLTDTDWISQYPLRRRAYASDNMAHGLTHDTVDEALTKRFIQTNPSALTKMIVLDCDYEDADRKVQSLVYDDGVLPEPNWITVNPESQHAHVGYYLGEPVTMTAVAKHKPIAYAAVIDASLRAVAGGDPAYTGFITRNPLHGSATTIWGRSEPYSLGELRESLGDRLLDRVPSRLLLQGVGRHVTLFEHLRLWAYEEKRSGRHSTFESFRKTVYDHADVISIMFVTDPLPVADVRSCAKSVSNWTWRKYDPTRSSERSKIMNQARWERDRKLPLNIDL